MAGSANVVAAPSMNATARITGQVERLGRLKPMFSLNGISPRCVPSINNMSPTITARMPSVTDCAPAIDEFSTTASNNARNNASGTTHLNCSMKRTLT